MPENGLLAAINNLSYNIEISQATLFEKTQNTVMPQVFKVTVDFSAIHEQTIGFNEEGNSISPSFPYGADEYAFDPKRKVEADASYRKRIQFERDNQAAADGTSQVESQYPYGFCAHRVIHKRGHKPP